MTVASRWAWLAAAFLGATAAAAKGRLVDVTIPIDEPRAFETPVGPLRLRGAVRFTAWESQPHRTLAELVANKAWVKEGTLAEAASIHGVPVVAGAPLRFHGTFPSGGEVGVVVRAERPRCGAFTFRDELAIAAGRRPGDVRLHGRLTADADLLGVPVRAGESPELEASGCGEGQRVTWVHSAVVGRAADLGGRVPLRPGDRVSETELTGDGGPFAALRIVPVEPRAFAGYVAHWAVVRLGDFRLWSFLPAAEVRTPQGVVLATDQYKDELDAIFLHEDGSIAFGRPQRVQQWRGLTIGRRGENRMQPGVSFWPDGTVQCAVVDDARYRALFGGPARGRDLQPMLFFSRKGELLLVEQDDIVFAPQGNGWRRVTLEEPVGKMMWYLLECDRLRTPERKPLRDWLNKQ